MTKKLFIAIVLGLLCLFAACSSKPTTAAPQQQPSSSQKSEKSSKVDPLDVVSETYIAEKVGLFLPSVRKVLEATYTNKNNCSSDVVVPNAQFANVKILEKQKDGDYFVYDCTADFSNADWIGTARFKVSFTQQMPDPTPAAFVVYSVEFAEANAEPGYPLDFSDENIYLLFEERFRYKANPDDHRMTLVDVNKDTLHSVKMLEFIPDSPDNTCEYYKVELHFVDGLILQGTMFTDYWPRMWDEKDEGKLEGIEKWEEKMSKDDFIQVK